MSIRFQAKKHGMDYDELTQDQKFHLFLGQLVDFGKIDDDDFDNCSINYSKIPECCVENFFALLSENNDPYEYMREHYDHPKGPQNHVMCPKCIKEHYGEKEVH